MSIERAVAAHRSAFGADAELVVRAPGRVNLIGEHTDYNDGFVLPMAIGMDVSATASSSPTARFEIFASDLPARFSFDAADCPKPAQAWHDHVVGAIDVLTRAGHAIPPARIAIAGDVPHGAGLSSSAALSLAVLGALSDLNGLSLSRVDLARFAQRSENEFVDTACGIMDQLVSAQGQAGAALMIDCRSLDCTPVDIPQDWCVLIAESGVTRQLAASAYNDRRSACVRAAKIYGVPALRDLTEARLLAAQAETEAAIDPVDFRRARHVVTENARVLAAVDAFRAADLERIGRFMRASHRSMQTDFEITVPKVDELVTVLNDAVGTEGGARMTGGGFGGCVVAIMPQTKEPAVRHALQQRYRTPDGAAPTVYEAVPSSGLEWRSCR